MNATKLTAVYLLSGLAFVSVLSFVHAQSPQADSTQRVQYHPYRRVAGRYVNLQAIYNWQRTFSRPSKGIFDNDPPNPMPDWVVTGYVGHGAILSYRVAQVSGASLFVQAEGFSYTALHGGRNSTADNLTLLINYPYADRVIDGQKIEFIALKVGTTNYTDLEGAKRTIRVLDYGVPYNPWSMTNSAASSPTNSSP